MADRAELVALRDSADRLHNELAAASIVCQRRAKMLETTLATVSDVAVPAVDRELRVRLRNLKHAAAALNFEVEKAAVARDSITRYLAAANGVTTQ